MQQGKFTFSIDKRTACAFTGHRADSLPWGDDENDERCAAYKAKLIQCIREAVAEGKRTFLCGMASGTDVIAAKAVLELKKKLPDIRLICVFPYPFMDIRTERIASSSDGSVCICEEFTSGALQLRNRYLIENSSMVIAGFDGRRTGGTYQTLCLANEKGLRIIIVRPQ